MYEERLACCLCGNTTVQITYTEDIHNYDCKICGCYKTTKEFMELIEKEEVSELKHLLSGYVREMNDNGKKDVFITKENFQDILANPLIPQTPMDKVDKLIMWYYKNTMYFGNLLRVNLSPSICYAYNNEELKKIYEFADGKFLKKNFNNSITNFEQSISITMEGYLRCNNIEHGINKSLRNAFVAMWFSKEVQNAYDLAIKPAIDECGFKAFRVDDKEHNNDITDEIIAGIKSSRFIVADLTGNRAGVYYEAGFARGLGIPVILTCRDDWFNGQIDEEKTIKEKVHFDVNHLNIIKWNNVDKLKEKLIYRIKGTIL